MKTKRCEQNGCPIADNMDITRSTTAEKKATAEALYKTGKWTMEGIGERLGVTDSTITRWLSNFPAAGKLKRAKTASNPKGAGRPKGSKRTAPPARHAKADQIVALLGEDKTDKEIAAETGVSVRTVRRERETENTKRAAEAQIDPAMLSMTARQKFDAAIKQYQRKIDLDFERRVAAEVERRINAAFPRLKEKERRAEAITTSYTPRFSKRECQDVARCLHPDTWQSLTVPAELLTRLKKAFVVFGEMQSRICVE
jgi:predicted ArsR family transcriptional regulator